MKIICIYTTIYLHNVNINHFKFTNVFFLILKLLDKFLLFIGTYTIYIVSYLNNKTIIHYLISSRYI